LFQWRGRGTRSCVPTDHMRGVFTRPDGPRVHNLDSRLSSGVQRSDGLRRVREARSRRGGGTAYSVLPEHVVISSLQSCVARSCGLRPVEGAGCHKSKRISSVSSLSFGLEPPPRSFFPLGLPIIITVAVAQHCPLNL